jgi:hypothetical protein
MTTDKITNRVKALLARAEHPDTPPAEAQAAAAKAAELMMRHAITEATLRADTGKPAEPIERLDYTVPGTGGHGKARTAALACIARAYGGQVVTFGNDASRNARTIAIIGTQSALAALRILLPSLQMQMELAARTSTRAYGKRLREYYWQSIAELRKLTSTYYRDYLRGYGQGVASKIEAARTGISEEATGTSTALVLASDTTRIHAEYTRQFPKLRKPRHEANPPPRRPPARPPGRPASRPRRPAPRRQQAPDHHGRVTPCGRPGRRAALNSASPSASSRARERHIHRARPHPHDTYPERGPDMSTDKIAAATAAELMLGHAITDTTARAQGGHQPEPIDLECHTIPGSGGHGKARAAALAAVVTACGCEVAVHGNDASRYERRLLMVGTRSTLAVLGVLLPCVQVQMESAAQVATRAYAKRLREVCFPVDPRLRRTWVTSFLRSYLRGYGIGLAGKIKALRDSIAQEAPGASAEQVLNRDTARIRAEFAREFPELRPTRAERHSHPGALIAGQQAGGMTDLGSLGEDM